MALVPEFAGRTYQGKLTLQQQAYFKRHLVALGDVDVVLTVRKKKAQRSTKQNAWEWGVAIPLIAEHCGYDKHEHEALHYELVKKCFGVTRNAATGFETPKVRSSKLSTKEYSEFMEWLVRFAAIELGVAVPLPNEVMDEDAA